MDEIPAEDLKEMELDEAMDSDQDSDEEDEKDENDDRQKEAFIPGKHSIEKDEELVRDESAYKLYHEFQTGAPCLSFDIIRDDLNRSAGDFPATAFIVAGTMSQSAKDHLIVLKLSNMHEQAQNDPEMSDDEEEEDEAKRPVLKAAMVRHSGSVNRVRAKNFGEKVLAANWSERAEVHIWDLEEQLRATNDREAMSSFIKNKQKTIKPVYSFSGFRNEGYALDWSDTQAGHMLTGDNGKNIHYWKPVESGTCEWLVEQRSYSGHTAAVEDIQWSPNEASVFASCSTDKSIRIWDVRANPKSACMIAVEDAHSLDVNVISWNKKEPFIVSGGDDGVVKVWDLRQIQNKKSVAMFKHHSGPITSIEWCPQDSSVFAASGEDNQVTQWDLAVEREGDNDEVEVPPQLLFVHQGQEDIKEVHWHPQIEGVMVSTANSGFNIFKTISV